MRTTLLGVLGKIPRPSPAMGVALLALLIAASGAAVAAIPSSDGTITACRENRSGVVRIIDAEDGQTCSERETQLNWKDGINGKVANSDLLDGQEASDFYAQGSKVDNADKLDNKDSTEFANATHQHAGEDITRGTVVEARIDGTVARDYEVMPKVLASDGANSGLDADRLDGLSSTDFAAANHRHSTTIGPFDGFAGSIAGSSLAWVFAGPTTQVTLTTGQRITGSAVGVLSLSSGTAAQQVDVGLCYQPSSGGTINNFVGGDYTTTMVGDRRDTISAAASVAPAAGTYNIGFCVRNRGPAALSNNDYVNGWVMVTNN